MFATIIVLYSSKKLGIISFPDLEKSTLRKVSEKAKMDFKNPFLLFWNGLAHFYFFRYGLFLSFT